LQTENLYYDIQASAAFFADFAIAASLLMQKGNKLRKNNTLVDFQQLSEPAR
jgi:hypothetical protein